MPGVNLGTGLVPRQIVGGGTSTCVVLDNGRLKCFGSNSDGQLGLGDTTSRGTSAAHMGDSLPYTDLGSNVNGPYTVQQLALGRYHACAVLNTLQVKCWGDNTYGQLGYGDAADRGDSSSEMGNFLNFVDLGAGYTAKQVALGLDFSCALLTTGAVKCWGANSQGQLGLEFSSSREVGDGASEMGRYMHT